MIIKTATAKRLIAAGKAENLGTVTQDGKTYMIVNRYDLQRTDHAIA